MHYEVLTPVTDVLEAMRPEAPVLHDDMYTAGVEPAPDLPAVSLPYRVVFWSTTVRTTSLITYSR